MPRIAGVDKSGFEIGQIIELGTSGLSYGLLPCDGSAVSRTTYAKLFAKIGTQFGVGDGSTTFNVPDRRRKTGVGDGGVATGTLGNTVGSSGGAETHTLTEAQMPAHVHGFAGSFTGVAAGGGVAHGNQASTNTYSAGSNQPHNIMQPSLVLKYGIAYI